MRQTSKPGARRAFTLTECIVAMVLLGAVAATTVPLLRNAAHIRRETDRRQRALLEVGNALEPIRGMAYDEITPETLADLRLPANVAERLGGASLEWSVATETQRIPGTRVTCRAVWPSRHGEPEHLELTAWVFKTEDRE